MHHFDLELTTENIHELVPNICKQLKPYWSDQLDKITLKHLSGGITNCLYACHLSTNSWNHSDTILFRIYGLNTEEFISRSDEVSTMLLMKQCDLGPQIYGQFKNGICYELLTGEIITTDDAYNENIYTKVAEAMAIMNFQRFQGFQIAEPSKQETSFLFTKLDKLFTLVKTDYKANMPYITDDLLKLIPSKEQIKQEIEFVKKYLKEFTIRVKSLIVFSHNDLLLGNIIYNKEKDLIKFIDYEYGQLNFQAYDIANHFNEYAGVDNPDYTFFPNKDFQMKWLKLYLTAFYNLANAYHADQADKQITVDSDLVEGFYTEVNKFTSASHLLWSIWSLIQAQNSTIDFDFVNYARIRFEQYFKHKEQLV